MTRDQCLDQMAHVLLGMNRRADERAALAAVQAEPLLGVAPREAHGGRIERPDLATHRAQHNAE